MHITLDWNQIDTVLLDMDGTLLDLHFDNFFWLEHMPLAYAQKHNISHDEAKAQLFDLFDLHRGTLNWYCLDYWTDALGMPIADLKKDITHKIGFRPHVQDFLIALRADGKRSVIVTNAHRDSVNLKMQHTGLDKYVDRIISSHDYREPKESQAFWQHLMRDEPFDRTRTLLLDDSLAVLESAREFGIAQLLCIVQPDSQQAPRQITDFHAVDAFTEIMPDKHNDHD
jgi:5'-nucleotidase